MAVRGFHLKAHKYYTPIAWLVPLLCNSDHFSHIMHAECQGIGLNMPAFLPRGPSKEDFAVTLCKGWNEENETLVNGMK